MDHETWNVGGLEIMQSEDQVLIKLESIEHKLAMNRKVQCQGVCYVS